MTQPAEQFEPAGEPIRRTRPNLSQNIPIRFRPDIVAAVKTVAARDGLTVSAWVRRAVERALAAANAPSRLGECWCGRTSILIMGDGDAAISCRACGGNATTNPSGTSNSAFHHGKRIA